MLLARRTALLLGAAAPFAARAQTSPPPTGPYVLPPLPYAADALEPHIDAQTMTLHHGRHHAAYVNALNAAVRDHAALAALPLQTLLTRLMEAPEAVRATIRNNAGGHANHTMFWRAGCSSPAIPRGSWR